MKSVKYNISTKFERVCTKCHKTYQKRKDYRYCPKCGTLLLTCKEAVAIERIAFPLCRTCRNRFICFTEGSEKEEEELFYDSSVCKCGRKLEIEYKGNKVYKTFSGFIKIVGEYWL